MAKHNLASADDLSSYTWDALMDDLRAKGLFEEYLGTLISVTSKAGEERRRYHGSRATVTIIERYAEDARAHFALNVQCLRQENPLAPISYQDQLDRPEHWKAAHAIAGLLGPAK